MKFEEYKYNDFLALLFIFSSSVDLDFSDDEKLAITNKIGEESFNSIFSSFQKMKDIEVTDLLYKLGHKFCTTEDLKQIAIDDINEIIHVNGRKSRVEEDMLLIINKLI